jgi:hypothetical protein
MNNTLELKHKGNSSLSTIKTMYSIKEIVIYKKQDSIASLAGLGNRELAGESY